MTSRKKIAIIGSGISGLSAAYYLKDKYQITLHEIESRLGGHSRTIRINDHIDVDTGFIVLNDRTYPYLNKLFTELGIDLDKTEMSFAISVNEGELEWAGTSIDSLFAQRKNIFNLEMLKGIFDILKFNKQALAIVKNFPSISLKKLIDEMRLGAWFENYYLLPMGGAIWSCSLALMLDFPAANFINFFDHHGLLNITNRPQWYSLKNKSISYVNILENEINKNAKIVKNSAINSITRSDNLVQIERENNEVEVFDEIIFAINPEEILKILKDPNEAEKNTLAKFSRQKNIAYTHSDISQMPKLTKCWSSWNYICQKDIAAHRVCVTYWMNKLQHIDSSFPLFVTLNPISEINPDKIFDIHEFYHPVYNHHSASGQIEIDKLQGINQTWFCGAYLGNGFHEDGISSTIKIINKMDQKR